MSHKYSRFRSAAFIASIGMVSPLVAAAAVSVESQPVTLAQARDSRTPITIAQAPAAPQSVASQIPADAFIRNAIAIVQSLDAGGAASIYDAASAAMKGAVSKNDFVAAVAATNIRMGRVVSREWGRVERQRVGSQTARPAPSAVPAGSYMTVFMIARAADGAAHAEQVSFRLDEDNQWRLAGVNSSALSTGAAPSVPAQQRK